MDWLWSQATRPGWWLPVALFFFWRMEKRSDALRKDAEVMTQLLRNIASELESRRVNGR